MRVYVNGFPNMCLPYMDGYVAELVMQRPVMTQCVMLTAERAYDFRCYGCLAIGRVFWPGCTVTFCV